MPADAIEELILRRLISLTTVSESELDRQAVRAMVARVEIHAAAVHVVFWVKALRAHSAQRVGVDSIRRLLQPGEQVTGEPSDNRQLRLHLPIRLKVWGGRTWRLGPDGQATTATSFPDKTMIQLVRLAHAILRDCSAHPDFAIEQHRHATAPTSARKMKIARWAFLAPDIQRAILEGRSPIGSSLSEGLRDGRIPLLWSEQRALFQKSKECQ